MRSSCLVVAFVAVCVTAPRPAAQSLSPFTAEDMLAVATASVLDLSEDGARVAIAVRKLADNATTDHRRFGDPTYVAPALVDVFVYDTRSGASDRVFKQLTNVRQAAWSRDGARLALLTTAENTEQLPVTTAWIWDAARRTVSEVPGRTPIAATSELAWSTDGTKLLVATRDPADDRAAQATFKRLVDGPVIVHTSKDGFLDWDSLRRADRKRALVELDPRSGDARPLLPSVLLTDYRFARDGSFITYREDATDKTDYDVIFGTHNHLKIARNGATSTLVDGRTLKTTNPRWSDDGSVFAFAEKGEVFVQSVNDAKPRSLTPRPPAAKEAPAAPAGADEKKEEAESFSAGPFSRDNRRIVLTSRKGWYVATVADGTRERVYTLDDKNEDLNPRASVLGWTPDGTALLVNYSEADRWERGVMRLDLASRQLTPLVKDANLYQNVRYSRDGSTVVFAMSDGDRPAEIYAADAGFRNRRKLTDLNPWIGGKALPRSELVAYRDADGKTLYGVLRYPDDLRDLRDVLRQRLQRPGRVPGESRLRRVPPVRQPRRRPAGRVVGQGGHRCGQPADRSRHRRSGSPGRARHQLRGVRDGAAADRDRSLQGGDQHLGQGQHDQLLYGQSASRRAQYACA
jgi:dipeptidyl aminopeptidase/acylaminoacyl peptidase